MDTYVPSYPQVDIKTTCVQFESKVPDTIFDFDKYFISFTSNDQIGPHFQICSIHFEVLNRIPCDDTAGFTMPGVYFTGSGNHMLDLTTATLYKRNPKADFQSIWEFVRTNTKDGTYINEVQKVVFDEYECDYEQWTKRMNEYYHKEDKDLVHYNVDSLCKVQIDNGDLE
ncbi:hypothetical protein SS50377_20648 [Spironucleus salmonicida]|uniref:Uncharacterized protein n=1 Tax=Spironucleus salmonicida TaxID=348837 RepID=V6M7P7_9EUKA|nr:hypothetical protein SS50377_20648 [Spironucleus salmonicida]|eukprot:EST49499.1 Hypothetical protein SS50377_10097 [Spironucleus salmonicida]